MTESAMMTWVNYYKNTIDKVRCLPGTTLSSEVMIRAWYAYLAGIHLARGYGVLEQFLKQIVQPSTEAPHPSGFAHSPSSLPSKALGRGTSKYNPELL